MTLTMHRLLPETLLSHRLREGLHSLDVAFLEIERC